jgi:purine-binding chemotaxis protein CheW
MQSIVVFRLDDRRYALGLAAVTYAVRAVDIVTLPRAPAIVLGVINARGRILPVINMRSRFGFPVRELELSDHIIVARTAMRRLALLVDSVEGVHECEETAVIPGGEILPDIGYVKGVVKFPDGLVLIHDLDACLSLEEQNSLDAALAET